MIFDTTRYKYRIMCYRRPGATAQSVLALKINETIIVSLVDAYGLGYRQNIDGLSITGFSNMLNHRDSDIKPTMRIALGMTRDTRKIFEKIGKRVAAPQCEYATRYSDTWLPIIDFDMEPILDTLILI